MAFTAGTLADGQAATSLTTIYTVPASTKAYIKSWTIYNTNAATQTVGCYVKRSGSTARQYRQFSLDQNESADVLSPGTSIQLSTGDVLQMITTTATALDYMVTGVTEA
jgi:hypothetical protein